jgi:AcrR family transcriptional regulator
MSASNVVYHFPSRGDLMLALLDRISLNNGDIVQRNLKPEFNAYQRLLNHFEKNLEWATDFPSEAQIIAQIYAYAGHDLEFAKVFEVMFKRAQEKIVEHLLAGQREGLFHFQEDVGFLARLIHNMLVGAFINTVGSRLTSPALYPQQDLATVIKKMVSYSG